MSDQDTTTSTLEEERTSAPADAAVAEAVAEQDTLDVVVAVDEPPAEPMIHVEYNGETYEFKSKRLNAIQFRRMMQSGDDVLAVEWLIGVRDFDRFVRSTADEDGVTPLSAFLEFFSAIGKAAAVPNS